MIASSQLGFQSAALLGTQSLYTARSQIITSQMMLGLYQAGAITPTNIGSMSASNLQDSTINNQLQVGATSGNGGVTIDGQNKRMIMNDGSTNRIVIGNIN